MNGEQHPLSAPPLSMQLFLSLLQASWLAHDQSESQLRKLGLTGARLRLLLELAKAGRPVAPSELGKRLCVTKANISSLLGSLEQEGLIERIGHSADGRMNLARLTSQGEVLLTRCLPLHRANVERMMSGLKSEEQGQLLFLLGKLIGHLQRDND